MPVIAVKNLAEFQEIIARPEPSVFDFWATWCGPCRAISPIFEKHSNNDELKDVKFYKVDVDAAQDISQFLQIRAMPTFIAYHNGQPVGERLLGARPDQLETLVKTAQAAKAAKA